MFDLRATNYYIGFWFVGGKDQDWFAMVYREKGKKDWQLVHRFRYHNAASTDPFDGKDKKNFHAATIRGAKKNEEQVIEDVNRVASVKPIWEHFGEDRLKNT